jgi:spore maturation protein CgeB
MKIALVGSKDFDSLEYHLHDSLEFLGHYVYHIDISDIVKIPYRYNYWATKFFPNYDESVFDKIARKVIEQKPDLVIATYRFIHPKCISTIKKELPSIPVIHINPDQLTTFEHQEIFASPYDAYFTKDPYIVDFMIKKMRLNAYYLPEAFNPRIHKPIEKDRLLLENDVNIDVVAFGTMYPYRANMISALINSGIDVALFGVPDKRFPKKEITEHFRNEYITGQRKAEILYGSKIVFNNFHYAEIQSANVKYFEINGIGGFQICDYKPILGEYSKIDVHKYTYRSLDEAIELIKYYLPRAEERHQLAKEQMEHFRQYHTYENRIKEIFSILNI